MLYRIIHGTPRLDGLPGCRTAGAERGRAAPPRRRRCRDDLRRRGRRGRPTVFTVDPARLVRLACAGEDAPDERWWSRELPGIPFLDPCTR
ncbi:hypothetical protein [Parafrankia soli]|uniref:hypothetical protein n=1 Tax=Parafrankia soli TaxID=2599596 RepID=UPI0034D4C17F